MAKLTKSAEKDFKILPIVHRVKPTKKETNSVWSMYTGRKDA